MRCHLLHHRYERERMSSCGIAGRLHEATERAARTKDDTVHSWMRMNLRFTSDRHHSWFTPTEVACKFPSTIRRFCAEHRRQARYFKSRERFFKVLRMRIMMTRETSKYLTSINAKTTKKLCAERFNNCTLSTTSG